MRQHSQQSVDREMQQNVSDYRDDDRQQQLMSIFRLGNVNYVSKWSVEGIGHSGDKLDKPGRGCAAIKASRNRIPNRA